MRFFIFIILIIYLIPNTIIFIKCFRLARRPIIRLAVSLLFLILVSAFPVGEIWYNNSTEGFAKFYLLLGYYYLPVLLYSFLLFIVYQLVILLSGLFKKVYCDFLARRSIQISALLIILVVSIIITVLGHINFNNTRISQHQLNIPAKQSTMKQLKIAMAADLHLYDLTSKKFIDQFVEKVNSLQPDIVLLPGDIIEGAAATRGIKYFEEAFKNISSKYGVFVSPGNHEHYGGSFDEIDFFDRAGMRVLYDTAVIIDQGFYLAGLADRNHDSIRINHLLSKTAADTLPLILMNHTPGNLEFAKRLHTDIMLSGHTHHGQLWPLNMITNAMFDVSWGYKEVDDIHIFVTCGAQGWGPPVRTGSYSEIIEINIIFSNKDGS